MVRTSFGFRLFRRRSQKQREFEQKKAIVGVGQGRKPCASEAGPEKSPEFRGDEPIAG
jgi:hypothetical protein